MISEKPMGTQWPNDFFINVQRPEFESFSFFFFYDDQLSINILNYFTRFDCPWDYDSQKFRSFFMGRKGKRKQKFRLVIRYLVQDNITRPSLVFSNSNKILVREIDVGNSRVSQAKSLLTMVKLKSVLIFGIFQSINIVLPGPQNLVSATFPDDLGLHLSLM